MKKIINGLITAVAVGLFMVPAVSHAQTVTHKITAEELLPADIDIVYQLNTEAANPVEDLFNQTLVSEINKSEENILPANELTNLVSNNIFTFAMDTENGIDNGDYFVSFYVSKDNFATILENAKQNSTIKEIDYDGTKLYIDEYDTAVAFIDDELLIVSNKSEKLKTALDKKSPLGLSAAYKDLTAKDLSGSFFKMYCNSSFLASIGLTDNYSSAIKGESISVAQTGDGFELSTAVSGIPEKLAQYGLSFEKNNFTPALYQLISGEGLILYGEQYNLKASIEDFFTMMNLDETANSQINDAKANFKTETGMDIDTDILPLLENRIMITVHNSNVPIPGITLIIETGANNTDKAGQTLSKLVDSLTTAMQNAADSSDDVFKSNTVQVGGTSFYELAYTWINSVPSKQTLYLRMAETNDGYLIISTAQNFADLFRKNANGILDNTAVSTALNPLSEQLTNVSFFSTENLQKYLNSLSTSLEQDGMDTVSTMETINNILTPWHDIYSKSYATADLSWGKMTAKVDVAGLAKYGEIFSSFADTVNQQYLEPALPANKHFCDIGINTWYYEYVTDLTAHGIISGYPDGCFKPDQPITRAEFITLLMKATNAGTPITTGYQPFKDVPPLSQEWYSEYVNMAASMNYVTGYEDGTFRPNANVTRAEAVQILYNMSKQLPAINTVGQPIDSLITFQDVNGSDWFLTAVAAAKHYGLVQGVTQTSFEPNRNLTRAEAAKIVQLFLVLENQ
jgi:hypothetical protein